jgi:phage-related tail protein
MTGEEMERAIEFLLQSHANLEAQVAETGRQLSVYAETQSQFIEIVTTAMTNLADAQARTERTVNETNARLGETDARLNKLIGLFEQHIVSAH